MKLLFLLESTKNKNLPIGGGCGPQPCFIPEDAPASPLTEWVFDGPITRMPESAAPKLGKIGQFGVDGGGPARRRERRALRAGRVLRWHHLLREERLSLLRVQPLRNTADQAEVQAAKLPPGKAKIEVESKRVSQIGGPMDISLKVDGQEVAQGRVPATMSLHFTSNATFDIGTDLDSPVSLDYFDQAPFAFNGTIGMTAIKYLKK
jgi:hypothetical protein